MIDRQMLDVLHPVNREGPNNYQGETKCIHGMCVMKISCQLCSVKSLMISVWIIDDLDAVTRV